MQAYNRAKVYPDPEDMLIIMTVFVPVLNDYKTICAIADMPDMTVWYIADQVYYNDADFTFKEC